MRKHAKKKKNIVGLTGIYSLLFLLFIIIGIFILKFEYYLWHVSPTYDVPKVRTAFDKIEMNCMAFYWHIKNTPFCHKVLTDMFGNDIGNLIFSFLPQNAEEYVLNVNRKQPLKFSASDNQTLLLSDTVRYGSTAETKLLLRN